MKITIEKDMKGEGGMEPLTIEQVYAYAVVGERITPTGSVPIRRSLAHPNHIIDLIEKLYGMIERLRPLAAKSQAPPEPKIVPASLVPGPLRMPVDGKRT